MKKFLVLLASVALGCGGMNPGHNPDPVPISGRVKLKGKPVSDVVLNFQPTGSGGQAAIPVKNGEFRGAAMPGRYTYYLSEGANRNAFAAIPEKYRAGALDRQVDVKSGADLALELE